MVKNSLESIILRVIIITNAPYSIPFHPSTSIAAPVNDTIFANVSATTLPALLPLFFEVLAVCVVVGWEELPCDVWAGVPVPPATVLLPWAHNWLPKESR